MARGGNGCGAADLRRAAGCGGGGTTCTAPGNGPRDDDAPRGRGGTGQRCHCGGGANPATAGHPLPDRHGPMATASPAAVPAQNRRSGNASNTGLGCANPAGTGPYVCHDLRRCRHGLLPGGVGLPRAAVPASPAPTAAPAARARRRSLALTAGGGGNGTCNTGAACVKPPVHHTPAMCQACGGMGQACCGGGAANTCGTGLSARPPPTAGPRVGAVRRHN